MIRRQRLEASFAKISRPLLPQVLPRHQLFTRLDHLLERPVVWLSAPPGSGKTTLVASYLDARELPCLWYQIDRSDEDIATFFYYLAMASRQLGDKQQLLPLLAPEYLMDVATFTRRFFEQLFAMLPPRSLLVFDNFQEVPEASQLHGVILTAMEVMPAKKNALFISRTSPPPAMVPFKAKRRLATLGWPDLRLTQEETAGLAALYGPIPATPAIELIQARTEGWTAGVILLLEGMREGIVTPIHGDIERHTDDLFAYFSSELLAHSNDSLRDFLIRTSLFPRMTAEMALELSGNNAAGPILAQLHRGGWFTERHHTDSAVYNYHPLFREFLMDKALSTLGVEKFTALRQQAARILQGAGEIEEAASLFRTAGDWQSLVPLIVGQAQPLISQGRSRTVESWIAAIPDEVVFVTPWLLFWRSACRLMMNPVESRALLDRAYTLFEDQDDSIGLFLSWAGAADTYFYENSEFSSADLWIERLEERLKQTPLFPAPEIECRVAASMASLLTMRFPSHPGLQGWAARAFALSHSVQDRYLRLQILLHLYNHYSWFGAIGHCSTMIHEIGTICISPEATPLMKIHAKAFESLHLNWIEAEFEHSLQLIEEGVELARTSGVPVITHLLLSFGAYCAMNKGDLAAARRFIEGMKDSLVPARLQDASRLHFTLAWYSLVSGALPSALVHAETAVTIVTKAGTPLPETTCRLGLAEALHESGQHDRAEEELARAAEMASISGRQVIFFRYLMLDAWIALSRGDELRGIDSLRKGMTLGRELGLVDNLGWWRHDVMAKLCIRALEHSIEVSYVQGLIRRRLMSEEPPADLEQWPWPLKIHTFGRFGLVRDGVPLSFGGKVQQKPLELLKALIALGGRNVAEERLCDELWPDAPGDDAHKSFVVTLHRLRRLLGSDRFLLLSEGALTLNQQLCWVDAWAFTRIAGRARPLLQGEADASPAAVQAGERAIALYSGHFLAADVDAPWTFSIREGLRSRMIQLVSSLGLHWEKSDQCRKAADVYLRGLETDDLVEEFYQRLMICQRNLGDQGRVMSLYKRCCTTLAMLGIIPSAATRAIYEAALDENP